MSKVDNKPYYSLKKNDEVYHFAKTRRESRIRALSKIESQSLKQDASKMPP